MKDMATLVYKGKYEIVLGLGPLIRELSSDIVHPQLRKYAKFALALSSIVEDQEQIAAKLSEVFDDYLGRQIRLISIEPLDINEEEIEILDLITGEQND